ncbi:MAG: hypothetical protein ACLSE8_12760 [Parasutterella sp.]
MAASHQIVETYFKKLKEMKTIDLLVLDDWGSASLMPDHVRICWKS